MADRVEAAARARRYMDWAERQGEGGDALAGNPSFDLSYPKVPGRDFEGVPNANDPVMREKLRLRLLTNPRGMEDLPGFVKKASVDAPWQML